MKWFWIGWGYYYPGLRYTLALNAKGLGFMLRAWRGDRYVLRGAVVVPPAFLVAIGLMLQLPVAFYLIIGWWSAAQMASVLPGAEPPALAP